MLGFVGRLSPHFLTYLSARCSALCRYNNAKDNGSFTNLRQTYFDVSLTSGTYFYSVILTFVHPRGHTWSPVSQSRWGWPGGGGPCFNTERRRFGPDRSDARPDAVTLGRRDAILHRDGSEHGRVATERRLYATVADGSGGCTAPFSSMPLPWQHTF